MKDTNSGGPGTIDLKLPRLSDIIGRHRRRHDAELQHRHIDRQAVVWRRQADDRRDRERSRRRQRRRALTNNTIAFLNNALPEADGTPNDVVAIPKFQFVDQNGTWYKAAYLPIDDDNPSVTDFYTGSTPIVTEGNGGLLAIIPVLGGSGPQSLAGFPASLGLGSQATNAISVPLDDPDVPGTQVVGAPQLTMTYSGIGTSRHVYAQVVDKKTGLVVGNIVTPLPVTLDGRTHTQTYSMENIVWTYGDTVPDASDLELQIVGSATPYLNFTEYGYIDVKDVSVSLPTPGPGVVTDAPLSA